MRRVWAPFDQAMLMKEWSDLPLQDAIDLADAMRRYRDFIDSGWKVKNYGGGLMMITDSGKGQGRCLFFRSEVSADGSFEVLTQLTVYKKESRTVPKSVEAKARERMRKL